MPIAPSQFPVARPASWIVGLALLVASMQAASHELGRPLVQNHPPGEFLGGYECQAIAQDAAGVVYVANGIWVRSFDGVETWPLPPVPVESAGVSEMAVTAHGTVYAVGPSLVGYLQGSGRDAKLISLAAQLPPAGRDIANLRHVAAIGNSVCFSDDEKLLVWENSRFRIVPCPSPPGSPGARLHAVGAVLYASVRGRPLMRLSGDRLEIVADGPVVRDNTIVAMAAGENAGVLVLLTAEHGFYQVDPTGEVTPLPFDANRWLVGKRIFRALRLADGSWVVGFSSVSGDGGMRFAADGAYQGSIGMSIGLIVRTLRAFYADREGGLFIGTEMGFSRLAWPSGTTLFDMLNGLGDGIVTGIVRHGGTLFTSTTEGLFRLAPADDRGRAAHFELALGRPIVAVASRPDDLLALGTDALFASTPGGFVQVAALSAEARALTVSPRNPDQVWIATRRGVEALRSSDTRWRDAGLVGGIDGPCEAVSASAAGELWAVGPGPVVFRATPAGVERFAAAAGIPSFAGVSRIARWRGEPVFLFGDAGPYRFEPAGRRFVPVAGTEKQDGTPRPAECATSGPGGTLWFGGEAGLLGITDATPVRPLPHEIVAAVGRISCLFEEAGSADDVLWVGGENGLARVDVAKAVVPATPFRTEIRAVNVQRGQKLEPEHAPLTFTYIAPRFAFRGTVAYQTRLLGRDRTWSPWSTQRERTFPHLGSGEYRFEVRARDSDGVVSAPAEMAFSVRAPWWLTRWALGGYAAAGGLVLAGAVQLRTRALRQRASRLERIVAERTTELAEKNRELTRLHRLESEEKIAARLAEEKARLEVLRYQLNPHFLFNTLASISASLPPGRSPGRAMVERLAEFCRLTLHRSDEREWTTLGDEMRLIEAYLAIEKSRWDDMLTVEIDADRALAGVRLPYFLLLPLVENALKYGRATSVDRVGIRITARCEADRGALVIEVANTGEWIEPTAPRRVSTLGIGLENLRERLVRYYPRAHAFSFSHGNGWVTAKLVLTPDSVPAVV